MVRREQGGWPWLNVANIGGVLAALILLLTINFASKLFEDQGQSRPFDPATRGVLDPVTGETIPANELPGLRAGFLLRPPSLPIAAEDDVGKRRVQNLEVRMRGGSGFEISVHVTGEAPSSIMVPLRDGRFDYPQLTETLFRIKQAYESRQDLILMGDPAVTYGEILKAAAACRDKVVEGEGQKMVYPLFPSIQFADLPP